MSIKNFNLINEAFIMILPLLTEFVCSNLKSKDNNRWWERFVIKKLSPTVINNLPKSGTYEECMNSLDILSCFNIIEQNWADIFQYKMNNFQRLYARELKENRNKRIAHITQKIY